MFEDFQSKVAIVILNYKTKELLERFLPGILSSSYGNKEVWVVDNHSEDDSVFFVQQAHPEVKILETPSNLGYAGGYNWALNQIAADYYVLLNSDVGVDGNWLNPLVEWAIRDPEMAAIQPKILDAKDRKKFEYAGASGGFLDKWGYPFCRGRLFETLEEDEGQHNTNLEIFWATGACLFVRAEAYHAVGGLDEDFFAHMEEIDFCWRLKRAGHKVGVAPASEVYHIGGGTLAEGSKRKYYLNFRNNLWLMAKNHTSTFWFFIVLWRMVLDGLSGVKFILDGRPILVLSIIRAHLAYWASLGTVIKKRKEVKKLGNNQVDLYNHSVVWQYFAKKKRKFKDLPGFQ